MLVLVTAGKNAPVVHVAGILRNAGLTSLELTRAETICAKRPPELDGTPSARLLEAVESQSGLNAPGNLDMKIFCVQTSLYNHLCRSTPENLGSYSGCLLSLNCLKMRNRLSMFLQR